MSGVFKRAKSSQVKAYRPTVLVLGVGSFAHSSASVLLDAGANVVTYLTRDYGHYGAQSRGKTYFYRDVPNPVPLLRKHKVDLVLPMSIDWSEKAWAKELVGSSDQCPTGCMHCSGKLSV